MTKVESNFDEIEQLCLDLADSFDLTRDGMGADLLGEVAAGIVDRSRFDQAAPDGSDWPANKGKYGARKRGRGIPVGIGLYKGDEVGGEMLSEVQIIGTPEITPDQASMTYGINEDAKKKAQWFTRGSDGPGEGEFSGAKNQPPRPFYGLDEAIEQAVLERAFELVTTFIAGLGIH